ncbi:hypothetical protein BGZ73_005371 [Actinomortierella ambigua]|nr:hypothetical protein BGZ73_005371 [Actinomortierella ambigua]
MATVTPHLSSHLASQQPFYSHPPRDAQPPIAMSEFNAPPFQQNATGTYGERPYPMPPPSAPSSIHSTVSHRSTLSTSTSELRPHIQAFEISAQASSPFSSAPSSSAALRPRQPPAVPLNRPDGDKESLSSLSALRLERLDSYATNSNITAPSHTDHNYTIGTNNKGKGRASLETFQTLGGQHQQLSLSPTVSSEHTPLAGSDQQHHRSGQQGNKCHSSSSSGGGGAFWHPRTLFLKLTPSLWGKKAKWRQRRPKAPRQEFVYSNGELKSMFSNERIFLEWIKVAILLGTLSVTLLSFGNTKRSATPWIGLALIMCTLIIIIYSTTQFHVRMEWMLKQRDEEEGAYFYDRLAPTVLTVLLVGIMGFNAYVVIMSGKYASHNMFLTGKHT